MFHPCQVCSKSILSRYTLCITCLSDKASKEAKKMKGAKKLTKESCPTCGSMDLITLEQRLASTCSFCGESCSCKWGESVGMKQAAAELKMAGKNPKKLCCKNIDC